MVADSSYIPKENPAKPLGEDAHFFCQNSQVIGVADGVGGWGKHGIDAGVHAREMMGYAADIVKNSLPAAVDPKRVLAEAFEKTEAPGSSTACIICLAGNRLRAAIVGDSGFAVFRERRTVYRSPIQQSKFNKPHQLGKASVKYLEAAEEVEVEVKSGDVVVAGTDGLFDNLFLEEMGPKVDRCFSEGMSTEMVASELATAAQRKSGEGNIVSPFEVAAHVAGVDRFGGKKDDITVVVAYVIPS